MLANKTVELLLKSWPPVWRPKLSLESTCRLILSTKCILRGFKSKALLNSFRKPQEGRLCLLRDCGTIHTRRAIGLGAWPSLWSRWRFSGSFSSVLVAKDLTTNRGFLSWGIPKTMGFHMGLIFHDLEVPTLGNLQTASGSFPNNTAGVFLHGMKPWTETREPRHATSPHLSPEPHRIVDTDGCETWLRQQMCTRTSKIQVLCLSTLYAAAIKVSLEWCAISELGLKVPELFDVIIIKSASHHIAPIIYLHAVNLIIIGSSIIIQTWWISTMPYHSRITLCWISISLPKGLRYLDHSRIGLHGLYSKFTSSWCLCLPNAYKQWQKTFNSKIWVEFSGGSWNKSSWGCRCIRSNWIPWGPRTLQRVPGINSSPHSVSGKDIKRLAVFRPSKPAFPEVGSAHVFFCWGWFFEGPIVGPLNVGETWWNRIHR